MTTKQHQPEPCGGDRLTPEEVLATINDASRHWPGADPAKLDDRVIDFCPMFDGDLLSNQVVFFNVVFGPIATHNEWRKLLRPARKRTIAAVCNFIASRAQRPVVEERCLLGACCRSAGVFLALRNFLAGRGVAVDNLSPSTCLDDCRENVWDIVAFAALVAPGRLPTWEDDSAPVNPELLHDHAVGAEHVLLTLLAVFGFSCLTVGADATVNMALALIAETSLLGLGVALLSTRFGKKKIHVPRFGKLSTLRDLCRRLAT